MFLSKLLKSKKTKWLMLLGSFAMAMGIGATIGASAATQETEVVETKAASYDLPTSDGNLILAHYTDNGWAGDGAHIFCYFINDSSSCWTSTWINQDQFHYWTNGNTKYYFVYPSDTSQVWNKVIFVRCNSSATSGSFDYGGGKCWDQTENIALSDSYNMYGPYQGDDSSHKSRKATWLNDTNVSGWTRAAGDSLYFRNSTDWTGDNVGIRAHFWGNTRMEPATDVDITGKWVQGKYDDGNDVVGLLETALPGSGRWRWVVFERVNASNPSEVYNTSANLNFDTANNVWETWGGIPGGKWSFNVSDSERKNIFAGYIISQTAACTNNEAQADLSSSLSGGWANCKTQYNYMSATNQGSFWTASAADEDLGEAIQRYDRIVYWYGYERGDSTKKIGLRSGTLEDFINRHGQDCFTAFANTLPVGLITEQSPLTTTLWIVLASGVAGLGAIGAAYFISKKKRHKA